MPPVLVSRLLRVGRVEEAPAGGTATEWGAANNPADDFDSQAALTAGWPAGLTTRPLVDGNDDELYDRMNETISLVNGSTPVVIESDSFGDLTSFRRIGNLTGPDPTYAFGYYNSRLQGLLGLGKNQSIMTMAAGSTSQAQLDWMASLPQSVTTKPLQMGMIRIDGTTARPVYISGMTFQAADQPLLQSVGANFSPAVYTPTPSPHLGLVPYADSPNQLETHISYTRFLAAGRALNSQPPFECANIHTGRGWHDWRNLDIDGRRSALLDPNQPRRSGVFLVNSEYQHVIKDSWIHDSALSRYAANDQNADISGDYTVDNVRIERITDTRNTDPNLNGGNSLGGWTDATPFGWECSNGEITVRKSYVRQTNMNNITSGQIPCHFQLTTVAARNPQGGRFHAIDNVYEYTKYSQLAGYAIFRIQQSTYWWLDGLANTIEVVQGGVRLIPLVIPTSISWPPTAAYLAAQGASPSTHYLVRS